MARRKNPVLEADKALQKEGEIQQEYNQDPQKVAAACLEETNVMIRDKLRRK